MSGSVPVIRCDGLKCRWPHAYAVDGNPHVCPGPPVWRWLFDRRYWK